MLAIIRREYVESVRTRSFALSTVLVPLLMGAMMFIPGLLARSASDETLHVALADGTGVLFEPLDKELASSSENDFLSNGERRYRLSRTEVREGAPPGKGIAAQGNAALVVLPPGLLDGTGEPVYYSTNVGDFQPVRRIERALIKAVMAQRLRDASVPESHTEALLRPVDLKVRKISPDGTVQDRDFLQEWMTALFFTIAMYSTTLMAGMALSRGLLEEKANRVMEVLVSSVTPFQLMTGKIVGQGLVILSQFGIWMLVGIGLYLKGMGGAGVGQVMQAMTPSLLAFLTVYFLLGYFLYAALYSAVGAICTSELEAQQTQTPLLLMQLLPLVVTMAVVRRPDGALSVGLSMIPFFSPSVMMMRLALKPPPLPQVLLSVAILAVTIPIVFWMVSRIFRVGILMTGKKMTLPEMVRWLRAS
ncbi:MAG: ABC transporter permease [Candidatus Polarisedimenticolia bacterium]